MPKEAISSLYANRFHQGYARWKLRLDPVYHVVSETLKDTSAPVLDIGCGIGLLAHYLSDTGVRLPFTGVDFDRSKIAAARETSSQLEHVTFSVMDLRDGWPAHQGSVTLLDILQYVGKPDREEVLKRAAQRTAGDGRLIIRTGIHDSSWRFRFTQLVDRLANVFWWMKSGPQDYPTKDSITSIPIAEGLRLLHMHPLQGKLPFNNYVFVFVRD
jgi:2-polyprenyl-3-methyl-5-hydroxy-6-metoxy-1,4-benzoquinol methylase